MVPLLRFELRELLLLREPTLPICPQGQKSTVNTDMLLYQSFPTQYLAPIQSRVRSLVDAGRYFELKGLQDQPRDFIGLVPELQQFLDEYEFDILSVKHVFLMKVNAGSTAATHFDFTDHFCRCLALNIPIVVPETSRMNWYSQGTVKTVDNFHPYYGNYAVFDKPDETYHLGSLALTHPYLCRVDILHNVSNPSDQDRLIVSLAFDPDPTDRWPDPIQPRRINDLIIGETYVFID